MSSSTAAAGAKASKDKKKESLVVRGYLVLYNVAQTIGWLQVLVLAALEIGATNKADNVFRAVEWPLKVWQTLAVLEVFHVLFGLVKSSLHTTVTQVASRLVVLWAVSDMYSQSQAHWSFATMVLSWAVTEVIRYSYYVTDLISMRPYALLWMRYTFFFLLYPTGAGSEMLQTFTALPFVKNDYLYYFYVALLFAYLPLFPVQYIHMIKQRSKQLNPPIKKSN